MAHPRFWERTQIRASDPEQKSGEAEESNKSDWKFGVGLKGALAMLNRCNVDLAIRSP